MDILIENEVVVFNYRGHLLIGFMSGLPFNLGENILFVLLGSLLPDIDHPYSMFGRYNLLAKHGLTTHRGRCHTLIGCLLLSIPFAIIGSFQYVFIGCVSHILADWLHSWGKFKIRLF